MTRYTIYGIQCIRCTVYRDIWINGGNLTDGSYEDYISQNKPIWFVYIFNIDWSIYRKKAISKYVCLSYGFEWRKWNWLFTCWASLLQVYGWFSSVDLIGSFQHYEYIKLSGRGGDLVVGWRKFEKIGRFCDTDVVIFNFVAVVYLIH